MEDEGRSEGEICQPVSAHFQIVVEFESAEWLAWSEMGFSGLTIYTFHQNNVREKEEARLAFMETQKALNLISYNLNKGNKAVTQLKTFENTQNRIFINNK